MAQTKKQRKLTKKLWKKLCKAEKKYRASLSKKDRRSLEDDDHAARMTRHVWPE
jgi:hypothetical protein